MNNTATYITAPSTTAVRKIRDRKYRVQSFYIGGKDINEVLMRMATEKAYAETLEKRGKI